MALMTCPECGRQISSHATACPACGYPPGGPAAARGAQGALQSPHVWGRVATAMGAWLVVPWLARMVAVVAFCVVAYFMFTGGR